QAEHGRRAHRLRLARRQGSRQAAAPRLPGWASLSAQGYRALDAGARRGPLPRQRARPVQERRRPGGPGEAARRGLRREAGLDDHEVPGSLRAGEVLEHVVATPRDAAPLGRLQTLRIAASSVAPIETTMGALCVLALLGFRSPDQYRTPGGDH